MASEEARAVAEAEARARGMPAPLHWTNEDYLLKKQLEREEVRTVVYLPPDVQ
jgi:hypothetical protein